VKCRILRPLTSCIVHSVVRVKLIKIWKSFRLILYGCENWSLTVREERRLSVFENRVLRSIFGPKRDLVTGECRKLHKEELKDLYS
jgi:hypothetical protein